MSKNTVLRYFCVFCTNESRQAEVFISWGGRFSLVLQIAFYSFPNFSYSSGSITMKFDEDDDWEDEDFDENTGEGDEDF